MNLTAELGKIKNPHPSALYCCLLFQLRQKATSKKSKNHPKIINKQTPRNTTCFEGSLLFACQQETVVCLSLAKVYTAKTPQQLCSNPSHVIKDCRIQALNCFYYLESTELKSKLQAATHTSQSVYRCFTSLCPQFTAGHSLQGSPSALSAVRVQTPRISPTAVPAEPLSLPCRRAPRQHRKSFCPA